MTTVSTISHVGAAALPRDHGEDEKSAAGDLHIALQDATGDKPGFVVAEIPAKPHKKWCELRKIVFSWTYAKFPFRVRSGRKLKITEPRIITVTGKAFFDISHAPQINQTGEPTFKATLHGRFTDDEDRNPTLKST